MAAKTKLIQRPETADLTIGNVWQSLAADVEDSLVASGAEPNDDYTRLELYRLVQPIVVEAVVTRVVKVDCTAVKRKARRGKKGAKGAAS